MRELTTMPRISQVSQSLLHEQRADSSYSTTEAHTLDSKHIGSAEVDVDEELRSILRTPTTQRPTAVVSVAVFAQSFLLLYFDFLVLSWLLGGNFSTRDAVAGYLWIALSSVKTLVGLVSIVVSCCFCVTDAMCCIAFDVCLIGVDCCFNVILFFFHLLALFNLRYWYFEALFEIQHGYVIVATILFFAVAVVQVCLVCLVYVLCMCGV